MGKREEGMKIDFIDIRRTSEDIIGHAGMIKIL